MSGTIALLAAADALARSGVSSLGPDERNKELVLAFFHAEKWGYVGSRNWLQEVSSFVCKTPDGDGCGDPHRPDLAFTNLNISNFERSLSRGSRAKRA